MPTCNTYTPDLLQGDVGDGLNVEPEPAAGGSIGDDDVTSPDDDDDPPMVTGTASQEPTSEPTTDDTSPAPSDTSTPPTATDPEGTGGGAGADGAQADGGSAGAPLGGASAGGAPPEPEMMAAGGGGSSGGPVLPTTMREELIDDFEDEDDSLPAINGRNGYWFSNGSEEGEGTITPYEVSDLSPARDASQRGVHVVASGYATGSWALLGVELNGGAAYPAAAGYSGILFWARHGGDAEGAIFSFKLATTATIAADEDHYGIRMEVTENWVQYFIPFDTAYISQQGFGASVPFDAAELVSIQFSLASGRTGFDIWVDDVEFRSP